MSDATAIQTRSPNIIAVEIQTIKGHARDILLLSSVEIGRRLVEAKELVPHGEWMGWLKENVDYSQSTANNLMAIYREYGDGKFTTIGNLSYTKAVALLGVPAEEREQFADEHDVEAMSARELREAVYEKQKLERQLQEAEKRADHSQEAVREADTRISSLTADLAEAKKAGKSADAERLSNELAAARAQVSELEAALKNRPIEVSAVTERVPEEVERELEALRKKVAQPNGEAAVRFRLLFDALVKDFQDLLGALRSVNEEDPAAYEKYRGAMASLLGKMSERVGDSA